METCKLLRERHFGTLDRVPTIEYMAHPEFDGWGGRFTPQGAETREEVGCRARDFLFALVSRISKSHAGKEEDNLINCLIVSHGVVIMEFVRCLAREFKCYFPENATEELYENKVAPKSNQSAPMWHQSGTKLTPKMHQSGTKVVPKQHQSQRERTLLLMQTLKMTTC